LFSFSNKSASSQTNEGIMQTLWWPW